MTRFARGGSGNQKRPMEASSWNELKVKQKRKDQKRGVNQLHNKKFSKQYKEYSGSSARDGDRGFERLENTNHRTQSGSTGYGESQRSMGKSQTSFSAKREEYLRNALHKEQRSEKRRLKRADKRETEVVCYNCRESGHHMSECPHIKKDIEQGTGICFKCGSTEHTSAKCSVKVPKGHYPYAKCFVCGETGHLSKQCPDNPRGLYPMGVGGFTLQTLGSMDNPDAELSDDDPIPKAVKKKAGPKIVKF
ncbi:hypothetical protein FSP39_000923 [Pinctada imbricata]|uniref:CCHC-type domain-containing protein n=1 Tax=Pinctada imbricata TaxID=66713 RepID=A0AA88YGN7_PINIB|nr:hypothetical protein FSP39_000923 [Pinctada imbricata]